MIADIYSDAELDDPSPEWRARVQRRAALVKGIGFSPRIPWVDARLPKLLEQGCAGLCACGSEPFAPHALDALRSRSPSAPRWFRESECPCPEGGASHA